MRLLEKIYDKSPIFLQNMMVSISGYLRNRTRYGKTYQKYRRFLIEFDTWSFEKKLKYQNHELRRLLRYTDKHSLFYKYLYRGVDLKAIHTYEDLYKLPVVKKEMLRQNIDDVITIPHKKGVEGHTGGTTGKSLIVLYTPEDMMKRMALLDHYKARLGFDHRTMKRASFNGKHIIPPKQKKKVFWRYNSSCNQMIYSSFHLSEDNIPYYIESLNRFKPQALDGFCMPMCDIAGYMERNQISLDFIPIGIFTTSEVVTKSNRELLQRVFQCKVYDQYSSSEGAPFITECEHHTLHVEMSSGIFENMNEDNETVLLTSFTTYGTPLIRYQIGDEISFYPKKTSCCCGIESFLAKEIHGRTLDFLYTAEGAKINGGNVSNLFKNMPNALIKAQLIQDNLEEIKVLLEIDKDRYKPEYDDLLKEEFIHKFGEKTQIIIEHVDEIQLERSGKFRMIKNNVKDGN